MTEFYIPTNFEDSGKLAGLFNIRNVIEAGILCKRKRLEQYRLQQKAEQTAEHYISLDEDEWKL